MAKRQRRPITAASPADLDYYQGKPINWCYSRHKLYYLNPCEEWTCDECHPACNGQQVVDVETGEVAEAITV